MLGLVDGTGPCTHLGIRNQQAAPVELNVRVRWTKKDVPGFDYHLCYCVAVNDSRAGMVGVAMGLPGSGRHSLLASDRDCISGAGSRPVSKEMVREAKKGHRSLLLPNRPMRAGVNAGSRQSDDRVMLSITCETVTCSRDAQH
jgi:hypothetical protein